jgi:hypothetical protein
VSQDSVERREPRCHRLVWHRKRADDRKVLLEPIWQRHSHVCCSDPVEKQKPLDCGKKEALVNLRVLQRGYLYSERELGERRTSIENVFVPFSIACNGLDVAIAGECICTGSP